MNVEMPRYKFSINKIKLFIIFLFSMGSILINHLFSFRLANLIPEEQIPYIIKDIIIFINKYQYLIFIFPLLYCNWQDRFQLTL